jgi:hypothetical protein
MKFPADAGISALWRNYGVLTLIWMLLALSEANYRCWQASKT